MVKLFLAGDVMTGRGIDQILPHPSDPRLYEDYLTSALDYISLAERYCGEIPKRVSYDYIWGDALQELQRLKPDIRIVNLETAITTSRKPEPKGINYRMNPANAAVLTAAGIDCCVLSNNHVLDWGEAGLRDTLAAVKSAGILTAGAGLDHRQAWAPAIFQLTGSSRVLIFAFGVKSSGIPPYWAAGRDEPGIALLPDLSEETANALISEMLRARRAGDLAILSIHWGSNWGYEVEDAQRNFVHALIDSGACDIVHGHSSHHARPIELYRRKLVLYGCGDFINDYEGIEGHERFRGDLAPLYLAEADARDGTLAALRIVLFQLRRFRLVTATLQDVRWFKSVTNAHCRDFGTRLAINADASLRLVPI